MPVKVVIVARGSFCLHMLLKKGLQICRKNQTMAHVRILGLQKPIRARLLSTGNGFDAGGIVSVKCLPKLVCRVDSLLRVICYLRTSAKQERAGVWYLLGFQL